jgi:putative peptide modification system cyclase
VWENSPADIAKGAKPLEVEGLAKPVVARLMGLARPGQILLSGIAQGLAQRADREGRIGTDAVRWLPHGRYHLKGLPDPIDVFEVGEPSIAPMRSPSPSPKAWPAKPLWRHPVAALLAAASLIVAGVGLYVSTRSEPALAFSERDWVIIGDFVNVNADKSFDGPLGTAFRIGVEESQFVNVVPDLAIRQTLARMQRDIATRIDREIGSEIALREQARAVIMPSITQYGNKLRLAVELIDPNGARTVSTYTADAEGVSELLPTMDRLLRGIRTKLGETLNQIQATSQPLDKVVTPNLEALRALTRALQVERDGDSEQSARLLRYAIELDPSFATAYARLGSVLLSQERYSEGLDTLEKALTFKDRLTDRDRLFVRGILAEFEDPQSALNQWRLFAHLYPDRGTGQNNAGSVCYMLLHEYTTAETALTDAAVLRNPLRNYSLHILAYVLLAREKLQSAEPRFRAALAVSSAPILFGLSDALAVTGKFEDAARYLDETSPQPPDIEVERSMRRATLFITRGRFEEAAAAVEAALSVAGRLPSPNARWRAQAAMIALLMSKGHTTAARAAAARHLAELMTAAGHRDANIRVIEQLLYAAAWAARLNLTKDAREALALATARHGLPDRFPVRAKLATVAQAEVDLSEGHADMVATRLNASGNSEELWELHELRARAFRTTGDTAGELAELRWLTTHRGLAYAQWTDQFLGQQGRVVALHEADLRLAALSPPAESK